MGNLAAMPAIADHGRRRRYGIEILTNAARAFPPEPAEGSRFRGALRTQVIMIQEFPQYYATLTEDNHELVEDHVTLTTVIDAMKLGASPVSPVSGARSPAAPVRVRSTRQAAPRRGPSQATWCAAR